MPHKLFYTASACKIAAEGLILEQHEDLGIDEGLILEHHEVHQQGVLDDLHLHIHAKVLQAKHESTYILFVPDFS